jgi:hypothetical protein
VSAAFPPASRNEVDDGVGGVKTDGDTDDEADETSLHVEEGKGRTRSVGSRKKGRR